MNRTNVLVVGFTLLLVLTLAACGEAGGGATADAPTDAATDPGAAAAACPQDEPECVDTPELNSDEPVVIDETGVEQLRKDAQFYLGRPQGELNELIRIGRVDDAQMALTEDYRVGRITVELDTPESGGEPIVTRSTVELPDGPETFELER